MDYLWSPWRFRYVSGGAREGGCPFCRMAQADSSQDPRQYILWRGRLNFVFLNLYPYNPGHLLVAPYEHRAALGDLDEPVLHEMMSLARQAEQALRTVYQCEGFNLGLNQGRCAGAGVADHIHMHAAPRWTGDANFISVTGETRVLPEDLETTYAKLRGHFQ